MIQTLKHLCYLLKCNCSETELLTICRDLKKADPEIDKKYYRKKVENQIDKLGRVKERIMYPAKGRLRLIQERIKSNILSKIELPEFVQGGVKKRDNLTNAKFHQGKLYKFGTDLKKFYPTITSKKVYEMFRRNNFSPDVSKTLTQLTTFKGMLPQGTHTSTHIANLVFLPVDYIIYDFCNQNRITYTRFIDDLTMSSPQDFKFSVEMILDTILQSGFRISHRKTQYRKMLEVTGAKVGNNSLLPTEKLKKKLANIHIYSEAQRIGILNYLKRIYLQ